MAFYCSVSLNNKKRKQKNKLTCSRCGVGFAGLYCAIIQQLQLHRLINIRVVRCDIEREAFARSDCKYAAVKWLQYLLFEIFEYYSRDEFGLCNKIIIIFSRHANDVGRSDTCRFVDKI